MEFDSELCYHINKTISFPLYRLSKKNVMISCVNISKSIKETQQGFSFILYCKDYEVNYDLTGLDETRDFYNLDHLNVYGQQKFSDHLIRDLQNRYALAPRQQTEKQRNQWNLCSAFYNAYYTYSDQLIQSGTGRELSEDTELIKTLSAYLPR